jgi:hypothetical protein
VEWIELLPNKAVVDMGVKRYGEQLKRYSTRRHIPEGSHLHIRRHGNVENLTIGLLHFQQDSEF